MLELCFVRGRVPVFCFSLVLLFRISCNMLELEETYRKMQQSIIEHVTWRVSKISTNH